MARLGQITDKDRPYEYNGRMYSGGIDIGPATGSSNTSQDTGANSNGGSGNGYGVGATGNPTGGAGSRGSGSFRVTSAGKPRRSSYLRSARELADLYDLNYDVDYITNLYDKATDLKYALKQKEQIQAENKFYNNTANANASLLDTLRKASSSAIATGASRGLASAEQLGLAMEQQQNTIDEATQLAQDRANMADEIAQEKAQNIINALEYSDNIKKALSTVSSNVYSADTQYDVGELDFFAQMKNVEALFEQIAQEAATNKNAQDLQKYLGDLEDARARDSLAETIRANKANEANNAAANAAQKAYYDYMKAQASAGASGGGGYNNSQYTIEELKKLEQEAYANGDLDAYIAYRRILTDEATEDIKNDVKKDKYFKGSEAYNKANKNKVSNTNNTNKVNSPYTNNADFVDAMTLINFANQYGTNSTEFKQAYKKASKIVQKTYDNNYR